MQFETQGKSFVSRGKIGYGYNLHDIPDIAIASIPDSQLAQLLCKKRTIFSLPYTATGNTQQNAYYHCGRLLRLIHSEKNISLPY